LKLIRFIEILCLSFILLVCSIKAKNGRIRDYDIEIGNYKTGSKNQITDVKGVRVGHYTFIEGVDIRTGVTAILPHGANIFQYSHKAHKE